MSKKKKEREKRKGMPQDVPESIKKHLAHRKLRAELSYIHRAAARIGQTKSPMDSDHEEFWKKLHNRRKEILEKMLSQIPDKGGKKH